MLMASIFRVHLFIFEKNLLIMYNNKQNNE